MSPRRTGDPIVLPAPPTSRTAELLARAEADLAHFRRMHHEDGSPRLDDRARKDLDS